MFGEALSESRVETQTEEDKERLEEKEGVREIHKGGGGGGGGAGKPAPPGSGVQRSRAAGREGAQYVEQQGGRNN